MGKAVDSKKLQQACICYNRCVTKFAKLWFDCCIGLSIDNGYVAWTCAGDQAFLEAYYSLCLKYTNVFPAFF